MEAHNVIRHDACARLSYTFDTLEPLKFSDALATEEKLLQSAAELSEALRAKFKSLGREERTINGKPYTAELEFELTSDQLREPAISQSLGFVVDLPEVVLVPMKADGPYYILSPSISIGFNAGDYMNEKEEGKPGFLWSPDVFNEVRNPVSAWKYWLKVRTDLQYKTEDGIGFVALRTLIASLISIELVEQNMLMVSKAIDCKPSDIEHAVEKILLVAATCGSREIFSGVYSQILDAGDLSPLDSNPKSKLQFDDVSTELNALSMLAEPAPTEADFLKPQFLWCTTEEGASGLFAERIVGQCLVLSGLCFGRERQLTSLLNQGDQVNSQSITSLVSRAVINQIVRWF